MVSTHSRLKAAGFASSARRSRIMVSTHSRLKAAGKGIDVFNYTNAVSTHSRLKAAGSKATAWSRALPFQHTAA